MIIEKLTPEAAAMLRTAARDKDLGFHVTASWTDVQRKAKRIRAEGGVTIVIASHDGIGGTVQGDHGTYEALLVYRPGTRKVADWTCGCKWAAYAFDRSPGFERFEGRKCSHALALQFEAQSQGMFGKEVHPAEQPPGQTIVRYDPDTGQNIFARPYEGSLIGSLVARLRHEDADPAEVIGNLIRAGMKHTAAVGLWKTAGHHEDGSEERRCPHCGGFIGVEAVEHHHEGSARYTSGTATAVEVTTTDQAPAGAISLDFRRFGGVAMPLGASDLPGVHCGGGLPGQNVRAEGARTQVVQSHAQAVQASLAAGAVEIPVMAAMVDDELGWHFPSGHQPHEAVSVEVLPLEDDAPVAVPSPGSDPHVAALFLGKNDLAKGSGRKELAQPSVAGLCLKAHDTGRILMLQRGLDDENDPAAGTWEMPGGHIEAEDPTSLHAALREWQEEVGQPFPTHGTVKHTWTSPNGVYQGHVVVIPSEKDLSMKDGRVVPNPDDPKGDSHEQAAWWEVEHAKKNPALRDEVKAHTPWKEIAKASLDTPKAASAWDPISNTNPQPGRGTSEPAHSNSTNPASTGWAASEDPDNWNNLDANPEPLTPSLGFDAVLHPEPEAALPVAYGDENATMRPAEMNQSDLDPIPDNPSQAAELVPDSDANIHLLDGGSSLPNSYHASAEQVPEGDRVAAIVAAFQKSAVGQSLMAEPEGGDNDIAAAAKAHLAKEAAKQFDFAEQQELISEGNDGRKARNLGSLKLKGTHYELLEAALQSEADDPTDLFI